MNPLQTMRHNAARSFQEWELSSKKKLNIKNFYCPENATDLWRDCQGWTQVDNDEETCDSYIAVCCEGVSGVDDMDIID